LIIYDTYVGDLKFEHVIYLY